MDAQPKRLLVRGGEVYDHDGDVHKPAVADILIEAGEIVAVGRGLAAPGHCEVIDARGRLVVPGLINAHYHSHDTLCRGMFEELPLEMWLLYTLPLGQHRSKEEVRARTLVGALESLRCGITTVQDMLGLVPLDDDYTDVVIAAYREAGIRVVFSPMVWDVPAIAMVRHKDDLPPDVADMLGTAGRPVREQLDYLEHQFARYPAAGTLHWAIAPFAPQRCTPKMLEGCAELSARHGLAVYTHVYETRGQVLIARELFADHGGSLIDYLDSTGLLGPRLNIVHSVWISPREMERIAAADAGVVLNHLSNMKLKSGIAPVCDLREAGVRLGLGCDNCSGSDVQSVFQAMKMFCLLAAVSEPEPGPSLAHEALRHATLGNARTAGLDGRLGAIRPGYKADLILIDLNDVGYLPYNSAARQLVYTEAGRGVETVIVDGRVVVRNRKVLTIDEDGLRREVADLMRCFRADFESVLERSKRALPHMIEAHRRVWASDIGMNRFIPRTR
ncbi:MAG TPA: amidohydrolase family protein [Xanthobacteraceae bacterium]|jgi:cytosine/adenosine deaminase-related metal-dependent hydrolase